MKTKQLTAKQMEQKLKKLRREEEKAKKEKKTFFKKTETKEKIPSKIKEKELRIKLIAKLINEYKKGVKGFKPTEKQIKEYETELIKCKTRVLKQLQITEKDNKFNADPLTLIKTIDARYKALVSVYMDNNSIDRFYINSKGRTFTRKGKTYLIDKSKGSELWDKRKKLMCYHYFYNNPFAIVFKKNEVPKGVVDSLLLKRVLHFEYLQALANAIKYIKKMDTLFLFTILNLVLNAVTLILWWKANQG